jgi:hypothetical protein
MHYFTSKKKCLYSCTNAAACPTRIVKDFPATLRLVSMLCFGHGTKSERKDKIFLLVGSLHPFARWVAFRLAL